ncbi:mediator of RNA polymerase II transcription subunit 9 isoform X2 [Panulirus ornatus]|uniref:mediator of RNA polymerase II transcription subunit 9 isoform X2 n=1 Tax=Panulirus ornatus TaxID=150431 RepID=UPI003A85FF9C
MIGEPRLPWLLALGMMEAEQLARPPHGNQFLEKEPTDLNRVSQESSQKVLELQRKIQTAREQVRKLPGVEYSREEQLRRLEALRKQLALKKCLLLKYKAKSEAPH